MSRRTLEVLVVEDNRADAEMIKYVLEETGEAHRITMVRNGEEALQHLSGPHSPSQAKPDLVILDMNMPRMDGLEFLERARALLKGIYVVVISGSPKATISDFPHQNMVKPGTNEEIDEAVTALGDILRKLHQENITAKV